ncbi:PhzF family phenazine biosynthesis protein [Salisaeta longa]|uniref:PhzF family phenazine biosynthesis protein n=1 Tax=Salisaeta longa TaxID=503170 RepID=UPI0003B62080|nr:PhzF family phenazine biosynthesis protein [Salisaeta longa]
MTCYHVDAFADAPFSGNPAAVCVLPGAAPAHWMQAFAAEMNLSETAFVHPYTDAADATAAFALRWFTPTDEVDLCGHATLAAATVLWHTGAVDPNVSITFHTASGALHTWRATGSDGPALWMDFPRASVDSSAEDEVLAAALGAPVERTLRTPFDVMAVMPDADAVRTLTPDLAALKAIDARGVIATAPAAPNRRYDVISRFFAPRVGVPEDPVTGSAHCALATYWGNRLGRDALVGYQASARGGMVHMERHGARVHLGGTSCVVFRLSPVDPSVEPPLVSSS